MKTQDRIFFQEKEGDAWYERNKETLEKGRSSLLSKYLVSISVKGKRVLEIGCSNGYILAPLARRGARTYGIDPSERAIRAGKRAFPALRLSRGVSHDLSRFKDCSFDIVLVSFIFHWVDRSRLLQTISEIDRVLKPQGLLVIQDFDPDAPHKTRYKHRMDRRLYTYKQSYADIFLSSNMYAQIHRTLFMHGEWKKPLLRGRKSSDSCSLAVLRKEPEIRYPTRARPSR